MSILEPAEERLAKHRRSRVPRRHCRRPRRHSQAHPPASLRLDPQPDGSRPAQPSRAYRSKDRSHHRAGPRRRRWTSARSHGYRDRGCKGPATARSWQDGNLTTKPTPKGMQTLRIEPPPLAARLLADPCVDRGQETVARRPCPPRRRPDATLNTLREQINALAREHGMELRPGAEILEICTPGIDKTSAVWRLIDDEAQALLYIGRRRRSAGIHRRAAVARAHRKARTYRRCRAGT